MGKTSQSRDDRDINTEKFLRPEEVARMLGVHERTVWRLLKAKKLPGCKIGRSWIISRALLDKYVEALIRRRMGGK